MLGLVLILGLVACGDDADPVDSGLPSEGEASKPADSEPATPSPTPSEATAPPAPPAIPAAATKGGRAGAKAFTRFYIDLENYAKDTGDVAPLQKYSHPKCGGCGDLIRFYREWYSRGGWFKGGDRTITAFDRVVPTVPPHDMYVRISGIHKAGRERERQGTPVKRVGRERYTLLLWLIRNPQGWRVSRLDVP